ncbi:MAG: hypothetical protein ACKOVB_04695 [Terrabacter sp.]
MSKNQGADPAPPSRRSVVKGAAWAVPAVVVAGAAPTVAASVPPVFPDLPSASACKLPGNSIASNYGCWNKGYVLFVNFVNTFNTPVSVRVTGLDVAGVPDMKLVATTLTSACSTPVTCINIPAKSQVQVAVFGNGSTDSANNVNVNVKYTFYAGSGCATTGTVAAVDGLVSGGSSWTVNSGGQAGGSCNRPGNCVTPPVAPCA